MTHAFDTPLVKPLPRRKDSPWLRRALIIATFLVLVDAVFGDRGLAATRQARQAYAEANTALVKVQQANAGLREQVRRLLHDPSSVEEIARKELGLIRPGEVLFVVTTAR
jgi:cell division protein FtsB